MHVWELVNAYGVDNSLLFSRKWSSWRYKENFILRLNKMIYEEPNKLTDTLTSSMGLAYLEEYLDASYAFPLGYEAEALVLSR